MTQEQPPITPPPELVHKWEDDILNDRENVDVVLDCAWKSGYRTGADQELEACCEWIANTCPLWIEAHLPSTQATALRATRRPKPPTLKEQALKILDLGHGLADCDRNTLRRALEALPDD